MAAFTGEREWLETVIDHPVRRLSCTIVFPAARPCRMAVLICGRQQTVCAVARLPDGRTQVQIVPRHPQAHRPYLLRWWW